MYNTHQIVAKLKEVKKRLVASYPISELALFGSYARGDNRQQSDIDILIDFHRNINGFDFIKIAHELEDTFNKKIDLVSRKGIKAKYLPYVEQDIIQI